MNERNIKMKTKIYIIICFLFWSTVMLNAQQDKERYKDNPPAENSSEKGITTNPPKANINSIMDHFFPPEMVMKRQKAINLTEQQQATIKEEMKKTLAKFTDLEWERNAAEESMLAAAKENPVDEKKTLAEFGKLLAVEDSIKKAHLEMLIRVRNILTTEQQAKLFEDRKVKELRDNKPEPRDESKPRDNPRENQKDDKPPRDKRK